MEPFLDPYGVSGQRQAVVSGLCRLLKNFCVSDRFLYVTRVDPKIAEELHLPPRRIAGGAVYYGVGALRVREVVETHEEAAAHFQRRRYVAAPQTTSYPPNLVHAKEPEAAVARGACITYHRVESNGKTSLRPLTPDHVTPAMYRTHYDDYHKRGCVKKLRAALCDVETVDGLECLRLTPQTAPILTAADWGGRRQNQPGLLVSEDIFDRLCKKIATSGVVALPKPVA